MKKALLGALFDVYFPIQMKRPVPMGVIFLGLSCSAPGEKTPKIAEPVPSTTASNPSQWSPRAIRYSETGNLLCVHPKGIVSNRGMPNLFFTTACQEECMYAVTIPLCNEYAEYDEVSSLLSLSFQGERSVQLGGYLFEQLVEFPCTLDPLKTCCETCSTYIKMTDLKNPESTEKCNYVSFHAVLGNILSAPEQGACCLLKGLVERVVIKGIVERKGEHLVFVEMHSACRIP